MFWFLRNQCVTIAMSFFSSFTGYILCSPEKESSSYWVTFPWIWHRESGSLPDNYGLTTISWYICSRVWSLKLQTRPFIKFNLKSSSELHPSNKLKALLTSPTLVVSTISCGCSCHTEEQACSIVSICATKKSCCAVIERAHLPIMLLMLMSSSFMKIIPMRETVAGDANCKLSV